MVDHFTPLAVLMRSLSHELRTPLSVIGNELAFLKSQSSGNEFDLAIEKVKLISKILEAARPSGPEILTLKPTPASVLCKELDIPYDEEAGSVQVLIDLQRFSYACQQVPALAEKFGVMLTGKPELILKKSSADKPFISLFWEGQPKKKTIQFTDMDSFSEPLVLKMGKDSYLAAIVDAILLSHGVQYSISLGETLFISIGINVANVDQR